MKLPGQGEDAEGVAKGTPVPPDEVRAKPAPGAEEKPADSLVLVRKWQPPNAAKPVALALTPGGKVLAQATADRRLICWDIAGERVRFRSAAHTQPITALGFAPDGQALAVALKDGSVNVVTVRTGTVRARHGSGSLGDPLPVRAVALGTKGRIAAALRPDGLQLWGAGSAQVVPGVSMPSASASVVIQSSSGNGGTTNYSSSRVGGVRIEDIAVAPDGRTFACALRHEDRSGVSVFDDDARPARYPFIPARGVGRVRFAPDGRTVAGICAGNVVRLWDVANGQEGASVALEGGATVTALAISPDARLVALGTSRGRLHLWDPKTGKLEQADLELREAVSSLSFTADGKSLVAVTADLTVVTARVERPADPR